MLVTIPSFALQGIDAVRCDVEVSLQSRGLPRITLVGLPDLAVRESIERVKSAIIERCQLTYGEQRLQTTDQGAFPYGCRAEVNFMTYCSDGSFDLYDFRSEDERRTSTALRATLEGKLQWGGLTHELRGDALDHRLRFLERRGQETGCLRINDMAWRRPSSSPPRPCRCRF